MIKLTRKAKMAGVASLALALSSCATGPIPGQTEAITQSEAQKGAQYHPQLVAEFGGEMTGPVAQYVEQIGKNVAVESGMGGARDGFTVSLLNSPVNNAFAVPGGYIYTTRQLVALMETEAELAGVLAHEVAHVTARHSERRQRRAQRNQILGGLGAILSGVLLGDSQLGNLLARGAATAPQYLNLAYSREHEEESDRLGIDYMSKAGYNPRAMGDLLERLARQNELEARLQGRQSARPPVWASSHPEPTARVRLAHAYAEGKPGRVDNRDAFLNRIDGMIYGDDPKQGVVEGRDFIHPDLRLKFTAPENYYMLNGTRAVSINGQGGQAQFTTARYGGDLSQYVRQAFTAIGGQNNQIAPSRIERTRGEWPVCCLWPGEGEQRSIPSRRNGVRLRVRPRPGLSFRDHHSCRALEPVRFDVPVHPPDQFIRSRASHPAPFAGCDSQAGRHDFGNGTSDGL